MNHLRSHPLLSQLRDGIFQMNSLASPGPLFFFHWLPCFLLSAWMDSYFILASQHLCFTFVTVSLLESVWRGLDWQGRKTTISDLQDIKMLQQRILYDSLSCQRLQTQSTEIVCKGTLPTGRAWRQEIVQRHAGTGTPVHTRAYTRTRTYRGPCSDYCCVSSHHPHSHWVRPPSNDPNVL